MKILAADTAAKTCSVAIADNHTLVCELTVHHQTTHARFLMGMVDDVLKTAGLSMSDIDGFAVTQGPGSFTGLRIGISAFKGFAVAAQKPVVGVSSLLALAYPFSSVSMLICVMMDARKGEVYTQRVRFRKNAIETVLSASVLSPRKALSGIEEPCLFVGEGALLYRELIQSETDGKAVFARPDQHVIHATAVAGLAMLRFEKNDVDDVSELAPVYLRKPDAEVKPRRG